MISRKFLFFLFIFFASVAIVISFQADALGSFSVLLSQAAFAAVLPFLMLLNLAKGYLFRLFDLIVALIAWAFNLILSHAIVFHGAGLLVQGQLDKSISFSDALYFSIVTFTTLGYGDFQPNPQYRLVAALEALYGLIHLGLLVGVAASGFRNDGDRSSGNCGDTP